MNLTTLWPIAIAAAIFLVAVFFGVKGRQIRKALRRRNSGRGQERRELTSHTQPAASASGDALTTESRLYDTEDFRCLKCNSPNLRRIKRRWYQRPPFHRKARRFQCRDCKSDFLLDV